MDAEDVNRAPAGVVPQTRNADEGASPGRPDSDQPTPARQVEDLVDVKPHRCHGELLPTASRDIRRYHRADMARPHTPHHGDSSPPPEPAGGGNGSGGDPPKRQTAADSADGPDNVSAAQEQIASRARLGRVGGPRPDRGPSAHGGPSVQGPAAQIPLKPPNARHNLDSIRPGSPAKNKNTVVLPGTDVAADLADISAGRGTWNTETNRYEVNGRTYAVESTGTVFPVSGPGFVSLSRSEYKVLKQLIGSGGDVDAARNALRRDPSVGDADWHSALAVFQHHKSYGGGA
ncbi:hypothetical protein ACIA5D_46935 [Actinoplanes sp. NPDC051513]|uniref:hypothetical protein n=1 Tax=Actinoplanes sp. NPDC051513 TaxID=3363908 RepID=UPI0037BB354C